MLRSLADVLADVMLDHLLPLARAEAPPPDEPADPPEGDDTRPQ